jgi:hypothetical protein
VPWSTRSPPHPTTPDAVELIPRVEIVICNGINPSSQNRDPRTAGVSQRRGRDSNPRGGVSPLRHFECRALDRTMRPLQKVLGIECRPIASAGRFLRKLQGLRFHPKPAEGEGFEPSRGRKPPTAFPVPRTRPDYAIPPEITARSGGTTKDNAER